MITQPSVNFTEISAVNKNKLKSRGNNSSNAEHLYISDGLSGCELTSNFKILYEQENQIVLSVKFSNGSIYNGLELQKQIASDLKYPVETVLQYSCRNESLIYKGVKDKIICQSNFMWSKQNHNLWLVILNAQVKHRAFDISIAL